MHIPCFCTNTVIMKKYVLFESFYTDKSYNCASIVETIYLIIHELYKKPEQKVIMYFLTKTILL